MRLRSSTVSCHHGDKGKIVALISRGYYSKWFIIHSSNTAFKILKSWKRKRHIKTPFLKRLLTFLFFLVILLFVTHEHSILCCVNITVFEGTFHSHDFKILKTVRPIEFSFTYIVFCVFRIVSNALLFWFVVNIEYVLNYSFNHKIHLLCMQVILIGDTPYGVTDESWHRAWTKDDLFWSWNSSLLLATNPHKGQYCSGILLNRPQCFWRCWNTCSTKNLVSCSGIKQAMEARQPLLCTPPLLKWVSLVISPLVPRTW